MRDERVASSYTSRFHVSIASTQMLAFGPFRRHKIGLYRSQVLPAELHIELGFTQMFHDVIQVAALGNPALEEVMIPARSQHIESDHGSCMLEDAHTDVLSGNAAVEIP